MTTIRRALILVDVQNQYFDGPLAIQYPPRDVSVQNIVRLIDHAEKKGIPVVAVQHTYPAGAPVFAGNDFSTAAQAYDKASREMGPGWIILWNQKTRMKLQSKQILRAAAMAK